MAVALMERITDALQREHDLIIELRGLASEFADHVERMSDMTYLLQARYQRIEHQAEEHMAEPEEERERSGKIVAMPQSEEFRMPNALKGGPQRRE